MHELIFFCNVISSQGSNSHNHSTPLDKISDAWKEGMESRMDFLQTNLTELLHLIKHGAATVPSRSVNVVPTDTTPTITPVKEHATNTLFYMDPEALNVAIRGTEDSTRAAVNGTLLQHYSQQSVFTIVLVILIAKVIF